MENFPAQRKIKSKAEIPVIIPQVLLMLVSGADRHFPSEKLQKSLILQIQSPP
jgi:hypothetical protein